MFLAQTTEISTSTVYLLAGLVTVGIALVGFVMKLIEWKLGNGRQKQSLQCQYQHSQFMDEAKHHARCIDRLTTSQSELMDAVKAMTAAITTETEIAKLRHQEVMKSLEIMSQELRALNNRHG